MADQEKPSEASVTTPAQPVEEVNPPYEPSVASKGAVSQDATASSFETAVPPPPSVVVPANNGGIPRWFYFIFGATVIAFFAVTTLLLLQLTQKPPAANLGSGPTATPRITSTVSVSPSLLEATDAAILKLKSLGSSDEIASIETDLENTDLTVLDKGLEDLDNQLKNSF